MEHPPRPPLKAEPKIIVGKQAQRLGGFIEGMAKRMEAKEQILALLADGESLNAICKRKGMPSARSVYNWINDDREFASEVTRARECGYLLRAERAVEDAKAADDAALGRLALDAERWYLGKLSIALSDKQKVEHSGPDGRPIQTESALDVSNLTADQLRALASIPVRPE